MIFKIIKYYTNIKLYIIYIDIVLQKYVKVYLKLKKFVHHTYKNKYIKIVICNKLKYFDLYFNYYMV